MAVLTELVPCDKLICCDKNASLYRMSSNSQGFTKKEQREMLQEVDSFRSTHIFSHQINHNHCTEVGTDMSPLSPCDIGAAPFLIPLMSQGDY